MQKAFEEGNFRDAYEGFRKLALDPGTDPARVGRDLTSAIECLRRLNRVDEIDAVREAVIEVHEGNWRLLWTAAQSYLGGEHFGFTIAGKFHRGHHRGGGEVVNAVERDRIRALQLMVRALPLLPADDARHEVSEFHVSLAQMLLNNRGFHESWRLQYRSNLEELPDYEEGWGHYHGSPPGAPVDAEGRPVYHHLPKSWQAAETDGQRWRFALVQATEASPDRLNEVRFHFAQFLQNQFGVQTMAQYGYFFGGRMEEDSERKDESGTYALNTLGEHETIARLATGIKRFDLPDEFNFIKLYRQIVDDDRTGYGQQALEQLAPIFENRRQYPKAADVWRQNIEKYGDTPPKRQRLEQIVGSWGRFESIMTQPAGQGASVEFRFRNGRALSLAAHRIEVKKLLTDVKAYLKSRPPTLDWQKVNIADLGYRLVTQNQEQYLGKQVAEWKVDLEPAEHHFDRRTTITTPLKEAGAYLLTAQMADGNTSKIIVWVADTAIVKKPLSGGAYHFVADAVTGKPIAGAQVELFGYYQEHIDGRRYRIFTKELSERTDADGQVIQKVDDNDNRYQWIVTATTGEGRFAYLGFTGLWHAQYHDHEYNEVKVFTITDRPVYRPGQTVNFKFWVRHARYDQEGSEFARQTFQVEIFDPKGEKVFTKAFTADEYGGLDGTFALPDEASLGVYQLQVVGRGGGQFRVEEYKKPEYEVKVDAPDEPVMLGEKVSATIKANYYFGSPVVEAKVKYKVLRTAHTAQWYPVGRWDWLYGRGYWWFAAEHTWYPGWEQWGCRRPSPWWIGHNPTPPEVVAERETVIGADGTVQVEIDTAVAKAIHPDQDHSYQIVAEVVDASRRTIVGTGNVLVARRPFKVFVWVNHGYFRVGDVIRASFSARTLDEKPVQGKGKVTLLAITYNKGGEPVEKAVRQWALDTDAQGMARLQIEASTAGQYRLKYELTDAKGHTIEGGYLFTIIGEGFDGSEFRFNDIELVHDKRDYQPGEKVKLQVNTSRAGGTVLLFARPANGVYLPPKVLRLDGKSTVVEVDVVKKDMPNFFIEAMTVADANVYTETREIHVPPEQRILGVEVVPSSEAYKPGQGAKVKLKLTDIDGRPHVGSAVLAIYDKSVEYISGGSNVPEIKEFFWNWRRHHHSQVESSLLRYFANIVLPGKPPMSDLGVFGGSVPEEEGQQVLEGRGELRMQRSMVAMADAAPSPVAAAAPGAGAEKSAVGGYAADGGGGAGAPLVQPMIRSEFADTALWKGALTTGGDGIAEVELNMPENLTTWKVKVWGMGHGTRVGQGEAEVVTRKDLIVRLQAPRFFVEKDRVVLSANVHNYLKTAKQVQVVLELDGPTLEPLTQLVQTVEVAAGDETRVDWPVKVAREGEAIVRVKALTDEESDAMQMSFPVYVHGMLKMESVAGALRPEEDRGTFTIRVPAERRQDETRLEVRYSPTLAGAMVDALPYLIDYPYGCTEQTLNRFLPAVITQNVLLKMGLDLKAIRDKRTNLNAQEIGEDRERAKGWQRYERNPVFDEGELREIVDTGVKRLAQMQLADGGWGWFSGWGERSYPHTTALVVHGLQIAKENDVSVPQSMIERGAAWLTNYQAAQILLLENAATKTEPYKLHADNIDAMVYMVLVDVGQRSDAMRDFLYRDRTHLAVYTKAMFGLALKKQDDRERLAMIMRNIEQFVVQDEENQTAYLNLPDGYWWYWYGSEYEAHAYYLKLLAATNPESRVASRLVKYLVNNRKHATYWNSTRDTAIVIEAMADYLKASGEDRPDMVVEVWLDGRKQKEVEINAENLFTFDNKFVLAGKELETGEHTVELKKRGRGPLYYNGYVTNFTLEDHITKAGLELRVSRKYYRLVPKEKEIKVAGSRGQAVDQRVEKYERVELENLETLTSGDLVEIELEIDSKNDYEYILFEDMKAAGFEPVELRSGYHADGLGAYMELRDNRVTFFVRHLARGNHSVAYRMRAEIPGTFSALPTRASAMYAPELKGNSDEIKLKIED